MSDDVQLGPGEAKVCEHSTCGKVFHRAPRTRDVIWERRRYCSDRCQRAATKQRNRARDRETR